MLFHEKYKIKKRICIIHDFIVLKQYDFYDDNSKYTRKPLVRN